MTMPGHCRSPGIFRHNDPDCFTGVFGQGLTLADGVLLGRAAGTFVRQSGGSKIALCFDGRHSSPILATAMTAGLLRTGVTVLRLGRGPLPLLLFGAKALGADAAVMVTGADEEPDRNGFQLFLDGQAVLDGQAMRPDQVRALLRSSTERGFHFGHGTIREAEVFESYVHSLSLLADPAMRALEVGVDAGNGAAGEVIAALARRIPGKYHLLHAVIDGDFPARHPWQQLHNSLDVLRAEISAEACDIGIAFDALGARFAILDAGGRLISGDILAALFPGLTDADPLRLMMRIVAGIAASGSSLAALVDRLPEMGRIGEMDQSGHAPMPRFA